MALSPFDQRAYDIRCEWGAQGIAALASSGDVVVIVDVLSFCTSVDVAVSNGASVYPYPWRDARAGEYARSLGALLADPRRGKADAYTLSPASLRAIPAGARLVLPSPNGATLSYATGAITTIAGCLRNAPAVARAARSLGKRINVIPAGERWPDGGLRPAIEDWIGAGAIVAQLEGTRSPEAELAASAFAQARHDLQGILAGCGSGRELIARGFEEDVRIAAEFDRSACVPDLRNGAYTEFMTV